MQNTKIIQLLSCLSRNEIKEFGKFVSSPFHNNRKDVIRFFDKLKKYYPDFNIDETARENIFKELYPGKKFDPNTIVFLSSFLFNLGKEYLMISNLRADQFLQKCLFLKGLDTHYSDNLFEIEYKSARMSLDNEMLNEKMFEHSSILEEMGINFNLRRNRQDKMGRNTVNYSNMTIYSFIVKLVMLYHDMVANKSAFNYDFKDSASGLFIQNFNFEQFISEFKTDNALFRDYLLFYYYLFMCFYHPSKEDYYSKLKEYSFKDFDHLNNDEKSTRLQYLIHYCIFQIETGNQKFLSETFKVYTEALEKKLYQFDSKDMGLMFFRNFVLVGLAAKEYDYIENFISKYNSELKEEYRDELLKLCYAMLYFEKKQYNNALNYLSKMDNSYPAFRLGIKHLYLKIYFEMNEYTSFFSLIDTYKHYLKNDKTIPRRTKDMHLNFLNHAGKLAKIKSSGNDEGLFVLKKELKENPDLDFRHKLWLMEKAEEI